VDAAVFVALAALLELVLDPQAAKEIVIAMQSKILITFFILVPP